ncbi:MAG: hypothetical protein RRB22_13645 [Gammaproteobacteria bacterium]|nr:hypothetical protein [Gammaproteobacteria bacterium]
MTIKSIFFATLLALVQCLVAYGEAVAEPLLIPKELADLAIKNECSQVLDFYARPGMILPPYLYGYLPGKMEDSAAFWCKKGKKYLLVFVDKADSIRSRSCAGSIAWRNYPGGLSLSAENNIPLDQFHNLTSNLRGPKDQVTAYPPVRSYYDGVETLFYCHNGEWFVRVRH